MSLIQDPSKKAATMFRALEIDSVQTRGIVKTSGFRRGVCKNRGCIKFKDSLVEFLENRRSSEKKKARKLSEKCIFVEPRLLQCT